MSFVCTKSLRTACLLGALTLGASLAASAEAVIKTVAGGNPSSPGVRSLNACISIQAAAPHGTDVYVVSCNVIYKVDALGVWTPVAGTGAFGPSGDGGPALLATLGQPRSISVDGSGNIFMVDRNRIREVDAATMYINTVAGTGTVGSGGDGGAATSAQLGGSNATAVFAYGSGNVLIADTSNHRVRQFTVGGTIQTIAGGGAAIPLKYPETGIAPLTAQINAPTAVFVDGPGNIFIADSSGQQRILEIAAATGLIQTVAGGNGFGYFGDGGGATSAKIGGPRGLFVDGSDVYIAEQGNNVIRKFTVGGNIYTAAGNGAFGFNGFIGDGGPAISAELTNPRAVFTDASHNIFIVEQMVGVREVVALTGNIQAFIANSALGFSGEGGPATDARLSLPTGAVADSFGNIFIVDFFNNVVQEIVAATGVLQHVAGNYALGPGYSGDNGPAVGAQLNNPGGLFRDGSGNIFIADSSNNVIREVVASTGLIQTVAGNFVLGAGYSGDNGPATTAKLNFPAGVFLDSIGNIFITDTNNNVVRKVDTSTGTITTVAGNGSAGYFGDGGPATSAKLNIPQAVFVDGLENIFIADFGNNVVRKVDSLGTITTVAGNGIAGYNGDGVPATSTQLRGPTGVFGDTLGNLFVSEGPNGVIAKFTVGGNIQTVAGTGIEGFAGDGGPATGAELNQLGPAFVAPSGSLVIADSSNGRIRVVGGVPESLSATSVTFGVRAAGSLHVTASGSPALTLIESGALPAGVTFDPVAGLLSGTPAVGADKTYIIGFTAANGIWSDVVQNFTLTVLPVQSIAVTPANPSVPRGLTQQFTATGTYADAVPRDVTASATWTSSRTTVATISASGLATAVANGNTNITAALGGISGFTVLAVPPPALVSISVTPANPSIAIAKTQQFTATGTYSDGTMKTITTSVTWTSDTTSVATITGSGGLATGVAPGASTIKATLGLVSGTTTLTVLPALVSIAITPVNPSIHVGMTQQFTATGTYSSGPAQDITNSVTWTSSKPGVATISGSGLATPVATGKTNIKAKSGGITSPTTTLTVTP